MVKNDLFFVFVFSVLCEKYYTDVLKYYIANWVSWVPRLPLLDLGTHSRSSIWGGTYVVGLEQHTLRACFLPQSMIWVKARVRHSPRPKRGGAVCSEWRGTRSLLPMLATPKAARVSASVQASAESLLQYPFLISKDCPPLVKFFYITFNTELEVLSVSDWNTKDFISHWSNQWHKFAFPQVSSKFYFLLTTCAKSKGQILSWEINWSSYCSQFYYKLQSTTPGVETEIILPRNIYHFQTSSLTFS